MMKVYFLVLCGFICAGVNCQENVQTEFLSNVHVSAEFLTPLKILDTDIKACLLSNSLPVACTTLRVCINHSGLTERIDLSIQYKLDSATTTVPRLFFLQPEGLYTQEQILSLDNTNTGACIERIVFVREDIKDKLSPIEAEVKFSVQPKSIQSPSMSKFTKDVITIKRNCGIDGICVPDLVLHVVPNVPTYLIGSFQLIELGVSISNIGEDSFETHVEIVLPLDIQFVNVKMVTSPPIICLLSEKSLICDVGNPLPMNTSVQFVALFQPLEKEGMTRNFQFDVFATTSTPELPATLADNHQVVNINVAVSTKLRLEAAALPKEVVYNGTALEEAGDNFTYVSELGPEVIHTYTINNDGSTTLGVIDVRIIILNATIEGHDLFYLEQEPIAVGGVACEPIKANYRDLKLPNEEPLPAPSEPANETAASSTTTPPPEESTEAAATEESETKPSEKTPDDKETEPADEKRRRRRYVDIFRINTPLVEAGILSKCADDQCLSIKCTVLGLQTGKFAQITLRGRVHVHSLQKAKSGDGPASVSTVLVAQVVTVPFIGIPEDANIFIAQAVTDVHEFTNEIQEEAATEDVQ